MAQQVFINQQVNTKYSLGGKNKKQLLFTITINLRLKGSNLRFYLNKYRLF